MSVWGIFLGLGLVFGTLLLHNLGYISIGGIVPKKEKHLPVAIVAATSASEDPGDRILRETWGTIKKYVADH